MTRATSEEGGGSARARQGKKENPLSLKRENGNYEERRPNEHN